MTDSTEELQRQIQLLRLEKEADLEYYRQKILNASLEDRKKNGLCWHPVTLSGQRYSLGEKVVVRLTRADSHLPRGAFQSGKIVRLFTHPGNDRSAVSGVVNEVNRTTMTVTLNASQLPNWATGGGLGIDLLFDEMAYREMEKALKQVIEAKRPRLLELREVLLGHAPARFSTLPAPAVPALNDSQNAALDQVIRAQDVAIVHGPPGTGKTTTLVQAIVQTAYVEQQVLVCAPSNAAVDLLVEKLGEQGLQVVRLGHPARVDEANLNRTVDARITQHPYYKDLKTIRRRAEELRELGLKYKRKFGASERNQRRHLLREASQLREEAQQLEHYIVADIFAQAQVVACTLVGAAGSQLRGFRFDTVFIDEAAQALEAASWIPVLKADRVILAGDHFQLPPTVKSHDAARQGLSETLFEKCIQRHQKRDSPAIDSLLQVQYRMNERIMRFSGRYFYQDALVAHESVRHAALPGQPPVTWLDTAGCGFNEEKEPETLSTFNAEEASLLLKHFVGTVEAVGPDHLLEHRISFGVIAPYKAQVRVLTELFAEAEALQPLQELLTVDTVDAFQGRERDVIYISLVRSNAKGEIGFLGDIRRTNVALTRAKKMLVVVGDSATLGSHPFYGELLDYINEIDAYRSAFELISP
ncbi:MAG: AAA domain-containing protein [Tunicatimonas sp.]